MEITLETGQRKILVFQFLSVAVRFAEVARTINCVRTIEECSGQMREAYDSALLLSIRASFTVDDCCVFDAGSSYVQESFGVVRERARSLRSRPVDEGRSDRSWLSEWEPMWRDPRPDGGSSSGGMVFAAAAVRRHLERIEGRVSG